MEDITDPKALASDSQCDRNVTIYGYVRGTHLRKNTNVHIPGECFIQVLDDFVLYFEKTIWQYCFSPDMINNFCLISC